MTQQEVLDTRAAGVAILPIWNGDGYGLAISGQGGTDSMVEHAKRAADLWGSLGLPLWCRVYLDVETGFWLNNSSALTWMETLWGLKFSPGLYLNTVSGLNHVAGYRWARNRTKGIPAGYWTSEWEVEAAPHSSFPTSYGYPGPAAILGYESELDLWQSWENINGVDYDVARTLEWMWPAKQAHVHTTCALKPAPPNHLSHSLKTLKGGDVVRLTGKEERALNPTTKKPETWAEVRVFDAHGVPLTGWIVSENLYYT